MTNEDQIIQAIKDLESSQKKQMNRILACEALMEAWVRRTAPAALRGLGEEYEAALDRLAAELPPRIQLPEVWAHWSALIAALEQSHAAGRRPPPERPAD